MSEKMIGLHKFELHTPCLVIDKQKLLRNLQYMQELAQIKKIKLRPHAKTHKCSNIAKLQLQYGAIGVCVAKISEAIVMAKNGITAILITSPVVAKNKISLLIELVKMAPDTMVVVDNYENALQLNKIFQENSLNLHILLDIDGGIGRTGVLFANAFEMIKKLTSLPNLTFKGIQCYAGHLQHISNLEQRRQKSHYILKQLNDLKLEILKYGFCCDVITGSGTGTFSIDAEVDIMTEAQPGSYTVMDQEYNSIEYKDDKFLTSMTILTTVVSTNHENHVTVDAGTKSIYRVETLPKVISHENLTYDWNGFGDEHGKIECVASNVSLPQLGEVIEMTVAHCDPTINLFDKFYVLENNYVVDIWEIDARG